MEIKKDYDKLAKKHKLPSFNEMDRNFDLSTIEGMSLVNIRKKLVVRFGEYCDFLEGYLYPNNAGLVNFYENRFLTDADRESMSEIFKNLMIMIKESFVLDLGKNGKNDAEFIKDSFSKWGKSKKELLRLIKIMRDSWKEMDEMPNSKEYFG